MLLNILTLISLALVDTVTAQNSTTTSSAPATTYTVSVGAVRTSPAVILLSPEVLTVLL